MALLLLLVLLRSAASAGAGAEPHRSPATALFVLGDSTVGCAAATASSILSLNLTTTTTTLPSSLSGEPCLFFHEARLRVPDLLAAKMGLPSPPPISALNGTASAAARGVNFGGGGGQLLFYGGGGGVRGPASVFLTGAVGQQVRLASETLQLLRLEAAAPGEPSSSPAAVFVLSFGADAYARLLARGPAEAAAAAPKHGRRGLARLLADRVARAVSELYEAGARRVAVMGVPPLGCAPRVVWERSSPVRDGGAGCVEEANELIQGYNGRLAARLDELRLALAGADVVFCDVYKGMMEIISNPTTEACCGLGPMRATVGCVSKEMACGAPERHVWWDIYSPTEAADALVTNWSWSSDGSGATSICGPISLQQLAAVSPSPPGA
ncbi:SGNH hydrolase-type esterase superfamily protein [Zea mays]|uniref:SGNH hydrolase-type esterase superfamily protein n=1 Tax=Zea mays TaxID=4577 RepID=A0A1D6QGX6_MAIZE|nr:SGNH hydrolase-type esterase superfamily protein [Zea mays]